MAFCTNCGQESNTAFCSNCGTGIGSASSAESTPQVDLSIQPISEKAPLTNTPKPQVTAQKLALFVGLPLAAIALVVVFFVVSAASSPFPEAIKTCGIAEDDSYIYIADDGDSLLMDGEGDESLGAYSEDIWCVLSALNVPESAVAKMEKTSSLMGVVTDSWDGINAEWTYHPDNGFDIVLKLDK